MPNELLRRGSVQLEKDRADRGSREKANADPPHQPGRLESLRYNVLGASPYREWWGLIPIDAGACLGLVPFGEGTDTYAIPKQRHEFNQVQEPLHASWSDLFLDLIFVGAGYRLGGLVKDSFYSCQPGPYSGGGSGRASASARGSGSGSNSHRALAGVLELNEGECVGLGLGLLYYFAVFQCLYRLWLTDMLHTARFEAEDRYHRSLDLLSYFFLCCAANSIITVNEMLTDGLWAFLTPVCSVTCLWILRFAEMALFCDREAARRRAAADVIDHTMANIIYLAAMVVLSPVSGFDISAGSAASVLAPVLMIIGGLWYELRLLYRLSRPYICLSKGAKAYFLKRWPVRRILVPHNIGFVIHRFNEFMMLMLRWAPTWQGETLLQLVISDDSDADVFTHYSLIFGGFVICVCMMFSYHISEPHHPSEHVLNRPQQVPPGSRARRMWSLAGILYMGVCMSFKSAFVLLAGVGIKLAIYDPNASPDAFFGNEQRLQLGIALCGCFVMNLILGPLHSSTGIAVYYSSFWKCNDFEKVATLTCRGLLCAFHLGICYAPISPIATVLIHAVICLLQVWLIVREKTAEEEIKHEHADVDPGDAHNRDKSLAQGRKTGAIHGRRTSGGLGRNFYSHEPLGLEKWDTQGRLLAAEPRSAPLMAPPQSGVHPTACSPAASAAPTASMSCSPRAAGGDPSRARGCVAALGLAQALPPQDLGVLEC